MFKVAGNYHIANSKMMSNIKFSKHKGWGVCANYSDGTLTVCRYGKTKQEAENKVKNRVKEYYGRKG